MFAHQLSALPTSAARPLVQPVSSSRKAPSSLRASAYAAQPASRADGEDYYALLGLTKNAGEDEIKAAYRTMQRRYHPDIAGESSAPMSARLNTAYKTLGHHNTRIQYDSARRRGGHYTASGITSPDGVVGPLAEKAITIADVDMQVYCEEQAVYWLQQWGNSFTFGCETPFQTPLQCDAIEHGLQIAFISVSRGQISSQGALQFKVLPNTQGPDGQVRVTVARVAIDPETALPGEGAVLKTLQSALRSTMRRHDRDEAVGIFSRMKYAFLEHVPLLNFVSGQDYDAYHIPHRCDVASHGGQAAL